MRRDASGYMPYLRLSFIPDALPKLISHPETIYLEYLSLASPFTLEFQTRLELVC